jgi:hypothetical protein
MKNPVGDKGLGIAEALRGVENLSDLDFPSDVDSFYNAWHNVYDNFDDDAIETYPEEVIYRFDVDEFFEKNNGKTSRWSLDTLPSFYHRSASSFLTKSKIKGFRIVRNK